MSLRALIAILVALPGCGAEEPPRATGLATARAVHTATALTGARVLIAGGYAGEGRGALATAETCDATRCRATGPLARGRGGHAAATLPDGRVLVAGGTDATTDIYDDGSFRLGPRMRHARAAHTTTPLADGRILVAGGYGPHDHAVAQAEVLDRDGRRFTATGRLRTARGKHAAVRLPDGRVLVAGDGAGPEIVDVPRNRSIAVPGRAAGAFATATPLGDGRTLVAGGYDDRIAVSDTAFVVR